MGRLEPNRENAPTVAGGHLDRQLGEDIRYMVVIYRSSPPRKRDGMRTGGWEYVGPCTRGQADDVCWQSELLPREPGADFAATVHPMTDPAAYLGGL